MHEYSIVQALLDRVGDEARAHRARKVKRLRVRIGDLAGVEPDLLKTAFDTFRRGSICDQAELVVTPVGPRWVCSRCNRPIATGAVLECPDCRAPARLAQGDEIILDRIEMEVD